MNRLLIISVFCLFACACATSKYHDRDRENPAYYEGTGIPITDSLSVGGLGRAGLQTPPVTGGSAAEALIESGISLAAYPDYYRSSTISGTCVIGDVPLEQVPCRHVKVQLADAKGAIVGTTETNDSGLFAFRVIKEKVYYLNVASERYSLIDEKSAPLMMGANVILRLRSKR
ncbi:MAG: hypothetical protein IPJ84_02735 [Bdellovibrionales bacterium]|nr:hypothetical protein [Bdellovibrionales bacterium]